MDSAYWDMLPDTEDVDTSEEDRAEAENSCSPDLEAPCAKCQHKSRLCKRCRERRRRQHQHQPQQRPSVAPRRPTSPSLETACFPGPATSSSAAASADHAPAPPEVAVPEVVLQHPPSDGDDGDDGGPDASQKSTLGVPGPVYAPTYTNSPSWMSTYTSSTRATTHTTTHERSRRDGDGDRDGDAGGDWLDVRRRRPRYPRRPRTSRRDARARSFGSGWGFGTGTGSWSGSGSGSGSGPGWGIEVRGWDAAEIEGGSYCVLEGARWEEQRVLAAPRQQQQQHQQQPQQNRNQKSALRKGRRRWRGDFGRLPDVSRTRSLPLAEPPTPRYVYDVFVVSTSGPGAEALAAPYVSERGRARAVYATAYVRGTGSARGPWGTFVPRDDGVGSLLGILWREGVWKGVVGCLHDVFGLGRGGGWMDDVD